MPWGVKLSEVRGFLRTVPGRVLCFALAGLIVVVSAVNALQDLRVPSQIGLPAIGYTQTGEFDYAVSLKPSTLYGSAPMPSAVEVAEVDEEPVDTSEAEEKRHVFFRSLIEEFNMMFTYDVDGAEQLLQPRVDVVVTVYATDPGVWEKDVAEFFLTQSSLPVVLDYELDVDSFENRVEDIEDDIGINAGDVNYRIDAAVHLLARVPGGGTVNDTYIHSLELEVDSGEVELVGPLSSSGPVLGASGRRHVSRLDYEVFMEPNALYDDRVVRSMGLPVAEPEEDTPPPAEQAPMQVLGPGLTYFPSLVHHIDGEFSYALESESRVNDLSHQVGVTITIRNGETWQKTLSIVPTRTENEDFTITFPIDINYYTAVIDAIGEETGVRGASHTLDIKATVQTAGVTNLGNLNETFTHTLTGTLEKASLTFDGETLRQSQEGEVGGGTRPNPAAPPGGWRTPWLAGVGIGLAGLGFLYWREQRLRAESRGAVEAAAAAISKKYRDLVVDVRTLPDRAKGEVVVPLFEPADLAKIADDAIKPMLHHASDGRHSYVVLDGGVRYEYVLESDEAAAG